MQLSAVTRAGAAVRRRAPCLALGFLLGACSWPGGSQETPPRPGLYLIAAAQGQVGSDAEPTRTSGYGSFLAGLFAGQAGDLSAAADFMLEALTLDPDNPQLLERAFILVASDGRQAKAVELARRLVEIQPENGLAALVLAVDSAKQGDPARAESLLSTMPERGLSDISGPLLRAWLRLAQDDMAGAESIISPLANRQGLAVFHGVHLAAMRDMAGDTKGAEVAYEAALADATQISLRLAILAGNFFERQGKPERALEVYRT
ncbi:MAG TPA: hypothetical protein VLL72_08375, partial [Kiloniellales bacterium]|nr:hypothetical protein [Kiloniellales bacterium]